MKAILAAVGLLASAALAAAQPSVAPPAGGRPPRYVEPTPYAFDDRAGWQTMFNGQTLAGWEGPAGAWRVENGAITSSNSGTDPAADAPVYLFWQGRDGGDLGDFEFKAEIRLEGERANSGVQFRAKMLGKTGKPGSEWESFGYQADMDYPNVQTGALIECCAGPRRGPSPRPFRATMGMFLRVTPASVAPNLIGTIGDPVALKRAINTGGWNQLHIVARGHVLLYYVNGRLMSGVIDDDSNRFLAHGRLALQLEGSGNRKVSYRNLWIRRL